MQQTFIIFPRVLWFVIALSATIAVVITESTERVFQGIEARHPRREVVSVVFDGLYKTKDIEKLGGVDQLFARAPVDFVKWTGVVWLREFVRTAESRYIEERKDLVSWIVLL